MPGTTHSLITLAPSTITAVRLAELYADAAASVMLVGETGVGKSSLAAYIHDLSGLPGELITHSAAEFTESLASSQLFGHERYAFTDAKTSHKGAIAAAAHGSLLLDDAHLLARDVQAKLLRALSAGVYRPVGSARDVPVLCRFLIGFGACPDALVAQGVLLPDLRYRLGHCIIPLATLAERREEIAPLAQSFLRQCPTELRVPGPDRFQAEVLHAFELAAWLGNIRDLKETVRAAYLHARHGSEIRLEHLPGRLQIGPRFSAYGDEEQNARIVRWALWRTGGRMGDAAKLIGAHRNTVAAYARSHGLHDDAGANVHAGTMAPPLLANA